MKYAYTFDDLQILPIYSQIESRGQCNISTQVTTNYRINVPIISSPMDTVTDSAMAIALGKLGGLGVIHRFFDIESQVNEVKQTISAGISLVSAAIGVVGDYQERAKALVAAGCKILLIDVAHGNTKLVHDALVWCKSNLPDYVDIIAGSVATADGAYNLTSWGADGIRIGIGGGSLCETRIRTGIGVPQVTAIIESLRGVREAGSDVPIIADGGIKTTGDVAKAISLGADSVMLGSLLAGTRESPGIIERVGNWPNEQLFKKYRGSASSETKIAHGMENKNVEGNSKLIPYKGKVERIISDISDGLRSAMSYTNSLTLNDFMANSNHILITQNGLVEAKPHLLL